MEDAAPDAKQATAPAQGTAATSGTPPSVQQRTSGASAGNSPAIGEDKQAGGSAPSGNSADDSKQVKRVSFSDAADKGPDVDMREADGNASADAATQDTGDANSECKASDATSAASGTDLKGVPEFKKPRHAKLGDIRDLLFKGMLTEQEIEPPKFLRPELPPHWKLPSPPDLKTNAYLVGVPACVDDIREGAFAMDGYGGATTLMGFEELSDDDIQGLKEICGPDSGNGVLRARRTPLSAYDLDHTLDSISIRREMASLMRHFSSTRFAERVFKTTGYLRQVLGAYHHVRKMAESQDPDGTQAAIDSRRQCKEMKRTWRFTRDYYFLELQDALGKVESAEITHKMALQDQKARYQDEIDSLESEKAQLKARLSDSETQVRILKSRLETTTMNPWKLSDFLQEHTDFTGNWERLHDLFKLCIKDSEPPASWDTVVSVTAMDKRKVAVAPYPEKSKRLPPSSGSGSAGRPDVLDLTGPGSKPRGGSKTSAKSQNSKKSQSSKSSQSSRKSQDSTPPSAQKDTNPKVHKVQRRPKDHQPGRDSVRRASDKTTVSKEVAHTMLPGGVVWKEVRPDVRQAILAGLKYDSAMEWIGSDRAAHSHFRQPQLIKMLVSMMYWRRLDKTPWSKYVPEAYYEMADERLDRRLRRGDVPAPWGNLDDHVVYPDEDADSTVDDIENDPDYQPPAQDPEESVSSSSSEEEEKDTPENLDDEDVEEEEEEDAESEEVLESKPPAKRPRSASLEKSLGSKSKAKKQRHKGTKKTSSAAQSSSATQEAKTPARPKKPSALARKSYSALDAEDLMEVEVPEDDETSWRIHGVLVLYPSSTKSASCQTPGFPEYEIHRYSYEVAHDRWDREAYQEILDSKPWDTMLLGRIRVFYFHERNMLAAKALRLVEDIVDAMHKHAQAIWERGHWVPIPVEDKLDAAMEAKRKARRNALRRAFKGLLERSRNTPGFIPSLLHEPGLWKIPDKCCYWIWEDPRVAELGGPECNDLETQLAEIDMHEPARVQWNTTSDDEWLQYVPGDIKRHTKSVAIRKLNPLSLVHS